MEADWQQSQGKNPIIIDDIVNSAATLIKCCEMLMLNGALNLYAFITHETLLNDEISRIELSKIKQLYITNSVENSALHELIKPINIANIITESIRANYTD